MNKQDKEADSVEPALDGDTLANKQEQQLVIESTMMCGYALSNGYDVAPVLVKRLSALTSLATTRLTEDGILELAGIHQQFARIIAPATPQAVVMMRHNRLEGNHIFGAIPIVRQIMFASLLFLSIFILIGQLKMIDEISLDKGILGKSGWEAVAVMGYLICCAGLGSCFAALYRLNNYVAKTTYDPRYDSTYWASILLGVIAGIFISELLFHMLFPTADAAAAAVAAAAAQGKDVAKTLPTADLGKPVLALMGGFSANMVYKVLQRLVDSMESLVKGDPAAINQAKREVDAQQLKNLEKEMHMGVANQLVALEQKLKQNPDQAQDDIRQAINDLLSNK